MSYVLQTRRKVRPITFVIPWIYFATSICWGSHNTITNQHYDTTFVGKVMASQNMFGRINIIATVKTHPIAILRGGDSSSDEASDDVDSSKKEDQDSVSKSLEIETELSQRCNVTIADTSITKQKNDDASDHSDSSSNTEDTADSDGRTDGDSTPIAGSESVGVMSSVKKSNAVGDPDGDDDDDDDDDAEEEEEDNEEDLFVFDEEGDDLSSSTDSNNSDDTENDSPDQFLGEENEDDALVERVQVEVEYTIEEEDDEKDDDDDDVKGATSTSPSRNNQRSRNLGGVGVRSFGQRFKNRNKRHSKNDDNSRSKLDQEQDSKMEQQCLEAWQSYVFFPPPPPETSSNSTFWQYLQQHQSSMDTDSKLRLDRRTLYAGLLTEWTMTVSTTNGKRSNRRKFLDTETVQALQAALSLATQPIWRKSLQRPNAIRLYEINQNDNAGKNAIRESSSTTLAMQETIALGLVCRSISWYFCSWTTLFLTYYFLFLSLGA